MPSGPPRRPQGRYNGAVTVKTIERVGIVLKTTSNEAAELGRQLLVELERLKI